MRGKPTSKSRLTGRCRQGKTRCRSCRDHPVEKSRDKRMGRYKRFAVDVHANPALADFRIQPSLTLPLGGMEADGDERWCYSVDTPGSVFVATVNSVIDAAFVRSHGGYGDESGMEDTTGMGCSSVEIAIAGDSTLVSDGREIPAIASAVERVDLRLRFSDRGCALCEESWSDVDLVESEGSSVDDDWSMVDDEEEDV